MDVQYHYNQNQSHNNLNSFKEAGDQVVAVMVPFPVQSHLNQLLQLSCLISSYQIPVHYVGYATHIRQVKLRFNADNDLNKIHFHEFPTPPFLLSSPPNKFPQVLPPTFDASLLLRQPVAEVFRQITATARRVIVINDILMVHAVQDISMFPNAESYVFNPISAFASFFDEWEMKGKSFKVDHVPEGLPSLDGCTSAAFLNFLGRQLEVLKSVSGSILNSCRSVEGTYIDLLGRNTQLLRKNTQLWAIGPLIPGKEFDRTRNSISQHKCLEWLDKQPPKSVLYVSFGTTTSMTDEQIKELAIGLEQSKHRFIWVLRDADKGDIFAADDVRRAELPEAYEERLKEVGMVVRDWAPQGEILRHPSTGGFMSHCGWNSCLESIINGVPIAAWPMHSDQPKNAFLVTDILKVGVVVRRWAQREEPATSSAIAKAIISLMASKEGEEMRNRAEELGGATRQSVREGGVSRMEMDSFIAHIAR